MNRSTAILLFLNVAIAAHPVSSRGQVPATDEEIGNRLRRLGEEIRDLESIQRRIEAEGYIVLLGDRGTALVSPEQAAGFEQNQKLRADTKTFLQTQLLPQLDAARKEHARLTSLLGQDPSERPSLPAAWTLPAAGGETVWPDPMDWTMVRGSWAGRFWIGCGGEVEGVERTGPFRLVLEGNGRVVGTFEEGGLAWPAPGTIVACRGSQIRCLDMADGWASGEGGGPDGGTYRWDVELGRGGAALTRVNGYFVYEDLADRCTDHDAGDISDEAR
ncbi:MAG TPA: hypothetical protein VIE68_04925 [Gemmatimonadota bacterium]|jgi:hypothetical protein